MALDEVKLRDWWKIVKREILSGIFLGTILGTVGFFRVTIWSLFSNMYGEYWLMIAITIGFSLLWGTLCGALLPLILRRAGVDLATSTALFVATIVDHLFLDYYEHPKRHPSLTCELFETSRRLAYYNGQSCNWYRMIRVSYTN